MIKNKFIEEKDYLLLSESLAKDKFHQGTTLEFFLEKNTVCSVYEDEKGPVLFVRGKVISYNDINLIQLDIQFLNNDDGKRNLKVMIQGFKELEEKAKINQFSGFFFTSNVPILKQFCIKRLGFQEQEEGLLIKLFNVDYLNKDMV